MKNKTKELEVDVIGGQNDPMTNEEQTAISTFLKQLKLSRAKANKNFDLKKTAVQH